MDGISAAGSIAGVAAAGIQLSRCLYDMCSTLNASRQEIQDIANNISLLSMVLEELDGVLCQDELHYKPKLQHAAQMIVLRCEEIFKDIGKHTGPEKNQKGKSFSEKAAWYFKRERVKPLRASLESLKSTLNILLHVVQLAKTTRNVEEYPGVKPIGHWYVRRERRGLVCLVIDNRHTVERLQSLEEDAILANENAIEEEQPISFAELFPVRPGSSTKRGESPERKFVVSFRSRTPRNDLLYEQEDGIRSSRSGPAIPDECQRLIASSSEQDPSGYNLPHQATSRLILDIIPHREADAVLDTTQNAAGSVLLEAKAEETVDTLMRSWTHINPKYFTDDEQSIASLPDELPSFRLDFHRSQSSAGQSLHIRRTKCSGLKSPRSRKTYPIRKHPHVRDLTEEPTSDTEEEPNAMPSPLEGRRQHARTTVSGLPSAQWAKDKRPPPTDSGYQSAQTPASPASAYGYSSAPVCLNSSPIPPHGPSVDKVSDHSTTAQNIEAPKGTDNGLSDRALDVVDRLPESLSLPSVQPGMVEGQSSEVEGDLPSKSVPVQLRPSTAADTEEGPKPVNATQNSKPVTLKDCLGRTFILPIQTCRTWPDMENLIRRSFSRIESRNSQIIRGDYDILSPNGDIILPEIWNAVIQPGWLVELRFWSPSENCQPSEMPPVGRSVAAPMSHPNVSFPAYSQPSGPRGTLSVKSKRRSLAWIPGRRTSANRFAQSEV